MSETIRESNEGPKSIDLDEAEDLVGSSRQTGENIVHGSETIGVMLTLSRDRGVAISSETIEALKKAELAVIEAAGMLRDVTARLYEDGVLVTQDELNQGLANRRRQGGIGDTTITLYGQTEPEGQDTQHTK